MIQVSPLLFVIVGIAQYSPAVHPRCVGSKCLTASVRINRPAPAMCTSAHMNSRENSILFHKCGIKIAGALNGPSGERRNQTEAQKALLKLAVGERPEAPKPAGLMPPPLRTPMHAAFVFWQMPTNWNAHPITGKNGPSSCIRPDHARRVRLFRSGAGRRLDRNRQDDRRTCIAQFTLLAQTRLRALCWSWRPRGSSQMVGPAEALDLDEQTAV